MQSSDQMIYFALGLQIPNSKKVRTNWGVFRRLSTFKVFGALGSRIYYETYLGGSTLSKAIAL